MSIVTSVFLEMCGALERLNKITAVEEAFCRYLNSVPMYSYQYNIYTIILHCYSLKKYKKIIFNYSWKKRKSQRTWNNNWSLVWKEWPRPMSSYAIFDCHQFSTNTHYFSSFLAKSIAQDMKENQYLPQTKEIPSFLYTFMISIIEMFKNSCC